MNQYNKSPSCHSVSPPLCRYVVCHLKLNLVFVSPLTWLVSSIWQVDCPLPLDTHSSLGFEKLIFFYLTVCPFSFSGSFSSCSPTSTFLSDPGISPDSLPLFFFFIHTHSFVNFVKIPDWWLLKSCLQHGPLLWTPNLFIQLPRYSPLDVQT